MRKIALDLEWSIQDGSFRCGSWWDGKELKGTDQLSTLEQYLATLPSDTVLVGHNIVADLKMLIGWGLAFPARASSSARKHFGW